LSLQNDLYPESKAHCSTHFLKNKEANVTTQNHIKSRASCSKKTSKNSADLVFVPTKKKNSHLPIPSEFELSLPRLHRLN